MNTHPLLPSRVLTRSKATYGPRSLHRRQKFSHTCPFIGSLQRKYSVHVALLGTPFPLISFLGYNTWLGFLSPRHFFLLKLKPFKCLLWGLFHVKAMTRNCSHLVLWDVWQYLEIFLIVKTWGSGMVRGKVLLASSRSRLEMLLNSLQCHKTAPAPIKEQLNPKSYQCQG